MSETSTCYLTLTLRVTEEIQFLKKCSVEKIFELREAYNLTDIWRIRNPKAKQYTFRQKHVSGFLQRRLDYFFISKNIQEFILDTKIIPAISSDHSPILISFSKEKQNSKSYEFWKFNNLLLSDDTFKEELKQHIQNIKKWQWTLQRSSNQMKIPQISNSEVYTKVFQNGR